MWDERRDARTRSLTPARADAAIIGIKATKSEVGPLQGGFKQGTRAGETLLHKTKIIQQGCIKMRNFFSKITVLGFGEDQDRSTVWDQNFQDFAYKPYNSFSKFSFEMKP